MAVGRLGGHWEEDEVVQGKVVALDTTWLAARGGRAGGSGGASMGGS